MVAWAEWLWQAEQWLLPAECMVCMQPLGAREGDHLVCPLCRARWQSVPHPMCEICGEPLSLGLSCRFCVDWPAGFGPVRSAVRLDRSLRHQVHMFKYQGWWRMSEVFAQVLVPLLQDVPAGAILVPVPLALGRRSLRGYNQAEQLAVATGALTGLPVHHDMLRRVRETPTQTRLAPEQRRANLAGAFLAKPTRATVVLIDDVFTTGATLVSAAAALLDAGAAEVRGLTFARAEAPLADAASRIRLFDRPQGHGEQG